MLHKLANWVDNYAKAKLGRFSLTLILQAESSPFVERLLKKGYEVIYLTEPVDEYCIQALPEFDGKRFQNVAKEGVKFDESEKTKESREATEKEFEPLLNWMKDKALKDKVFFWKL